MWLFTLLLLLLAGPIMLADLINDPSTHLDIGDTVLTALFLAGGFAAAIVGYWPRNRSIQQ